MVREREYGVAREEGGWGGREVSSGVAGRAWQWVRGPGAGHMPIYSPAVPTAMIHVPDSHRQGHHQNFTNLSI